LATIINSNQISKKTKKRHYLNRTIHTVIEMLSILQTDDIYSD